MGSSVTAVPGLRVEDGRLLNTNSSGVFDLGPSEGTDLSGARLVVVNGSCTLVLGDGTSRLGRLVEAFDRAADTSEARYRPYLFSPAHLRADHGPLEPRDEEASLVVRLLTARWGLAGGAVDREGRMLSGVRVRRGPALFDMCYFIMFPDGTVMDALGDARTLDDLGGVDVRFEIDGDVARVPSSDDGYEARGVEF